MIKTILSFIFAFATLIYSQTNVDLLSNLNQYPSQGYNDIWGYVDGSGIEYALLGCGHGTSIVRVDNPSQPQEVAFIPGPPSIWRDIKTHGTYAYIVTEGTSTGRGLQIVDLSQLPTTATLVNTIETWFTRAHNIFIDNGFAYVIGTNNGGGMHILDLSNPTNPTHTAYYTASGYIHDVYVWNDTVVVCAGSSQIYQLIDVTNKNNPQLISSSASLPGIYAHSGWMTEDKRYFIGCEEFNVRDITVWDLVDKSTWDLVVPNWESPSGNSIVHNLFVLGNFAHISYYTSGYVVLDISNPTNPVLAGQYDTYPQSNGGTYDGAWGCYPYLPSGNTLISDIQTGLYVLHFNGTIPVEITSFTGRTTGNSVTLNWETSTEKNNQGFEIQRKYENEFRTIGFVEGYGTTTEPRQYSYIDKDLNNGVYEYRLKQVDFDGSFTYSDIVEVDVYTVTSFELRQNFPNPFNPSTKINFSIPSSEFVNLSIYNVVGEKVGELVNEPLAAGEYNISFEGAYLPSGIYITQISAGIYNQSIKMTLLK